MLDKLVCTADVLQAGKADLRDDGPKLAACRGDTVCRGPVTRGEDLSRNNERGNVRPEVLEEVGQAVQEDKPVGSVLGLGQRVIGEAHNAEENSEDSEPHQLDRFTSPRVDEQKRHPITRDETSNRQDDVSDRYIIQTLL